MRFFLCFPQLVFGTAYYYFMAEVDEFRNHILNGKCIRTAFYQGHVVDTITGLQFGILVQLVLYNAGIGSFLQVYYYTGAFFIVRFVVDMGNSVDNFIIYQLANLITKGISVHLIRHLRDDNHFPSAGFHINLHSSSYYYPSPSGMHCSTYSFNSVNDSTCGEIRAFNVFHQLIGSNLAVIDIGNTSVNYLIEVVWKDVGGHPYRDTTGTVDQQVGNPGWQYYGLFQGIVEVELKVYRFFFDIHQHGFCHFLMSGFCITHGGRAISILAAKVTLTVNHHITHVPRLGLPNHGIVYCLILVGVVLTQYLPYDTGRFFMRLVVQNSQLIHGIENPSVHGLQTVSYIRKRTADYYRH